MSKEYNGWSNCETWCVVITFDNDKDSYDYWREVVRNVIDNEKEEEQVWKLAVKIKEKLEDEKPEDIGIYGDLLSAAISEIDFNEIAESWINDVKEEKKNE